MIDVGLRRMVFEGNKEALLSVLYWKDLFELGSRGKGKVGDHGFVF
jgi:hypothetical protein